MRIVIGSDEAGFFLKGIIKDYLSNQGYEVDDFGTYNKEPTSYPDKACEVAEAVKTGKYERGILICGTGIGMCITANKVPGIRAALCNDTYSAERAKKSNDAQIITLGERVIGPELAKAIVRTWLNADTVSPTSAPKIERIMAIEKKFIKEE